ncbi:glycosyltransferase family 4 protein [soil metagenome]
MAGPRLLFIAFPFPPSRGAGVYRTVAVANHLAARGWDVTAIAPDDEYFDRYQGSEDRSLISWVSPSVRVKRVLLTNPYLETDVRRMSLARVAAPTRHARRVQKLRTQVSPLDHYPFWYEPVVREGLRASFLRRFDVILATGNPFSSFVAARELSRLTKRPYVLDYRDAWTLDQFEGTIKPGATETALALEYSLLSDASGVISVNEEILGWLNRTHRVPSSVQRMVIPNGFDPHFVGSNSGRTPNHDSPIQVLHIGTLVPGKMDWESMLGQFSRTAHTHSMDLRLDVYGHLGFSGKQETSLRDLFEHDGYVNYQGPVNRAQVSTLYDKADVLYLPLYESPYVTSGKVYEMMATGKPILAWGAASAGALKPLQGYPSLVRADTARPSGWADALATAARMAREPSGDLARASRGFAVQYERDRQLEPLDGLLRRIARRG